MSPGDNHALAHTAAAGEDFIAPASSGQQRLWMLDLRSPGTSSYTMSAAWRITGELDLSALTRAVDQLVERHEALRTNLAVIDGRLCQKIAMRRTGTLVIVETEQGTDADREIEGLLSQEANRSFDLTLEPLFAARLFRFGSDLHVLTFAIHHAVCDEESLSILAGELWQIYGILEAGGEPRLSSPPVQYADFAAWQQQRFSSGSCEASLRYWEGLIAGSSGVLDMPLVRAAGESQGAASGWTGFEFDVEISRSLAKLAERTGATLFMTGAALLQLLLYRSTGFSDFLMGYPSTWRDRRELEPVVGMFVNMLMLRARINGSMTFGELLATVREAVVEGQEHKDVPFEMVVERLAPDRSHGRNPLFQVAYAFGTAHLTESHAGRLRAELMPTFQSASKFDLTLYLKEFGGRLSGGFEFDTRRFDRWAVELLAGRMRQLADSAMRFPDCPIERLPAISATEHRMLHELAGNKTSPTGFRPITELVSEHVNSHASHVAVRWEKDCLTYGQLELMTRRVQVALLAAQVRPGEPVGIVLDACPAMVAAILGILRVGAAYVPLDPVLPKTRLSIMAERLRIRSFVSLCRLKDQCPDDGKTIYLDDYLDRHGGFPDLPAAPISPSQVAYFIYTSGSSGTPKPIAVTHGGISALVAWHVAYHGLRPGTVMTQMASPNFDACGWEILSCLGSGATLAIVPFEGRRDPVALWRVLSDCGANHAFMPTPMAQAFLRYVTHTSAPPRLSRVLTGGDRLTPLPSGKLGFDVYNHYGPTEATVVATVGKVDPGDARVPDIGKPIDGTRIVLLDRWGDLVPLGAPGEICISGPGLALGYWGQPAQTARSFVPDAFGGEPGGRLYRSGDLARYRSDGALEFLGRLDRQVKRNGIRIEPAEIEAALVQVAHVESAAVEALQDEAGLSRLIAVLVGGPTGELETDIREKLAEILPRYMIPDDFVLVRTLPLLPSGKIDRAAVRELVRNSRKPVRAAAFAPRAGIEAQLAAIWAQLLGTDLPGSDDNFFAMGGHSMLVIQLAARIRDSFGVEMDIGQLFERPSFRQQHEYLDCLLGVNGRTAQGEAADGMETGIV